MEKKGELIEEKNEGGGGIEPFKGIFGNLHYYYLKHNTANIIQ